MRINESLASARQKSYCESQRISEQELVETLKSNYEYLRRFCRLRGFAGDVPYSQVYSCDDSSSTFYRLGAADNKDQLGDLPFKEAVENSYNLLLRLRKNQSGNGVLFLRLKTLVYEALDYSACVPEGLGEDLFRVAQKFDPTTLAQRAEELGGEFRYVDARTAVIKDLLIASVFGAHYLYRKHEATAYDQGLMILSRLVDYIDNYLPDQHQKPRASFGLSGLAHYLLGRILLARGDFNKAHDEFRISAEAYAARLRQKELFLRENRIGLDEFEEKRSVTLRRAAIVSAFGDGYLSFERSQIRRALEMLTLARAVLAQTEDNIYVFYVDLLYWACKRALHSSDLHRLNEVIREMDSCMKAIGRLVPHTHHLHRAGTEMALSYYYRAKLQAETDNAAANNDCSAAMALVDDAITYAANKNPHLMADSLIIRSHIFRLRYRLDQSSARSLTSALQDAERALGLSKDLPLLQCDAMLALGSAQAALAEFSKRTNQADFDAYFRIARGSFQQALLFNKKQNPRLYAESYLSLARLCQLQEDTEPFVYVYLEKWQKIKDQVDHAYCHERAERLEKSCTELNGAVFLVKSRISKRFDYWEPRLFDFFVRQTLAELIVETDDYEVIKHWRPKIIAALMSKMGLKRNKAYEFCKEHNLEAKFNALKGNY